MKIEIMKSASEWLLTGACVVCWESTIAAQPEQKVQTNTPKETTDSRSATKPVVLAKNTNPKTGSVASTPPAKPLTVEEKRAVSRCWKRLMSMVREVNHAHRAKK
ncbi:hypothetical protein [Spirosoma arcticum]